MKKRTISAIILLIILIGSILISYKAFGIVMLISSILGFRELVNIKYGEIPVKRIMKKVPFLQEQDLIDFENNIISLTEKGFLLSNTVISEFI